MYPNGYVESSPRYSGPRYSGELQPNVQVERCAALPFAKQEVACRRIRSNAGLGAIRGTTPIHNLTIDVTEARD
jgi:hypothetical protein